MAKTLHSHSPMDKSLSFLLALIFAILTVIFAGRTGHAMVLTPQAATSRFIRPQVNDATTCIRQVQGALNIHSQHATVLAGARTEQVKELLKMRTQAWKIASFATFLFAFCMALLWTLIFWKYVFVPRFSTPLALALSITLIMVNFFSAYFWVRHSSDPQEKTVKEFQKSLEDMNVEVVYVKGKGARNRIGQFLVKVHSSYAQVPKKYWETDKKLPLKQRWWTLGWDNVSFIDFELATAQALKNRFELEAAGMKSALPVIKELCSQG